MSLGAHIFAAAVTIPSLLFILSLLRKGQLRTKYVMIWLPVSLIILVLAVIPGLLDSISTALGVSYPPTLLFVGAIALLLMLCIHFSWELSRLEERLRVVAERMAIDSVERTP